MKKSSHKVAPMIEKIALAGILIALGELLLFYSSPPLKIRVVQPEVVVTHPRHIPKEVVKVPILVYHYVEYVKDERDTIRKSLSITPHVFENQLKTLVNAKYHFITARALGEYLEGSKNLPQNPVILTFDDGYEDFYTDIFPFLQKYHVVATQYLISDFINQPNYMSDEQIKEIRTSGLVEFGSHTMRHPNLASLDKNTARYEIEESKEKLEELLSLPVVSFAYPYGGYNEQTPKFVKAAGYKTAVSTKGGLAVHQKNKHVLFRIHPGNRTGQDLLNALQ